MVQTTIPVRDPVSKRRPFDRVAVPDAFWPDPQFNVLVLIGHEASHDLRYIVLADAADRPATHIRFIVADPASP